MNTGQFLTLMDPGLANVWFEAQTPRETQYTRYMNSRSFTKLTLEDAKMAGFGALQRIGESEEVSFDEAIAPVTKVYNAVTDGLGYRISEKLQRKELYGQVMKFERALKRSAEDTLEIFAHGVLNNATGTTVSAGFDGLALASAAHTRMDGGATQSNSLSTALSLAALHTARTTWGKYVDDRGRPIRLEMQSLLVPVDLWPTAVELLESQMRPDTANDAVNVVNRFGLQILEGHYITSTTYWSIFGNKHDVNFIWDMQPNVKMWEEEKTDDILRRVKQGYGRGHGEWRGFLLGNS